MTQITSLSAPLISTFHGTVIERGDRSFDHAREVWNATGRDCMPALILRPYSPEGVAQAVRYAVQEGLPLAVRSGGHSPAAFATVHGGLVIDLSAMKAIEIDPGTQRVRVQTGLTWGEVAGALHKHGLAVTAGDVANVGVGGLTQGGGIGWFVRKHGLAIDRLRSAQLVTAVGDLLTVSDTEYPEVFWALRGAGANLGVITELEFEAHEAGLIYGGLLVFDASDPVEATRLMSTFAQLAHEAPEALTMQGVFMAAPPAPFMPAHLIGKTIFMVLSCYSGDLTWGETVLAPVRALGSVVVDLTGPMPYPALFQMTEEAAIRGFRHAVRSGFLNDLEGTGLQALATEVQVMQPGQIVQLRPLGGQMARVDPDATAFSHRDARFLLMVSQAVPEAELEGLAWKAAERLWTPVASSGTGLYGNFAGSRDEHPARAAFSARTLARLSRVKAQLDPYNVFARNVNVHSSVLAAAHS
ncbi:FAD-binding oxidoreductase [Deinococcus oregonensis]|uniref:FAD-binding oxidoreductase n=1 Tax=Deinococcus oregonensis TaxID=1805970 RepID=A0ABV6AZB9_9DEIO